MVNIPVIQVSAGQPFKRITFVPASKADAHSAPTGVELIPLNDPIEQMPASAIGPSPKPPATKQKVQELFKEADVKLGWSHIRKTAAGLHNLGNTCFMNSVLQCLTHTPPLAEAFLSDKQFGRSPTDPITITQSQIRRAYEGPTIVAPKGHTSILKQLNKRFRLGRQEDSHEFLRCLLDAMHESHLKQFQPKPPPEVANTTFVYRIFGGKLRSQIRCEGVDYHSNKSDPFLDLSLEINKASSLLRALQHFTSTEVLDGANKYRCPKNNKLVRAYKQITIEEAPNVLTVHLKRFEFGMFGSKINKKVDFDLSLDLAPFMSQRGAAKQVYDLYAVLVHHGSSVNSGHYICYVKAANNMWQCCDDHRVYTCSEREVLDQRAYILFYLRRHPRGVAERVPQTSHTESATAAAGSSKQQQDGPLAKRQRVGDGAAPGQNGAAQLLSPLAQMLANLNPHGKPPKAPKADGVAVPVFGNLMAPKLKGNLSSADSTGQPGSAQTELPAQPVAQQLQPAVQHQQAQQAPPAGGAVTSSTESSAATGSKSADRAVSTHAALAADVLQIRLPSPTLKPDIFHRLARVPPCRCSPTSDPMQLALRTRRIAAAKARRRKDLRAAERAAGNGNSSSGSEDGTEQQNGSDVEQGAGPSTSGRGAADGGKASPRRSPRTRAVARGSKRLGNMQTQPQSAGAMADVIPEEMNGRGTTQVPAVPLADVGAAAEALVMSNGQACKSHSTGKRAREADGVDAIAQVTPPLSPAHENGKVKSAVAPALLAHGSHPAATATNATAGSAAQQQQHAASAPTSAITATPAALASKPARQAAVSTAPQEKVEMLGREALQWLGSGYYRHSIPSAAAGHWDDADADLAKQAHKLTRVSNPKHKRPDEWDEEYDRGKVKKKVRSHDRAGLDLHRDGNVFQKAFTEGWRSDAASGPGGSEDKRSRRDSFGSTGGERGGRGRRGGFGDRAGGMRGRSPGRGGRGRDGGGGGRFGSRDGGRGGRGRDGGGGRGRAFGGRGGGGRGGFGGGRGGAGGGRGRGGFGMRGRGMGGGGRGR